MNKFSELCRLCATYQTAKIDIFSENGKKRKLKEKIHCCLPLQISEVDNLPRYLCFKCVFNLDNFYTFRKSCVEAVTMLKVFAAQAIESKTKTQSTPNTSLSMVHNLLPQVSITLKTVEGEDMSDMLKPEVVISNGGGGGGGGSSNSLTVEPIMNGSEDNESERDGDRYQEEEKERGGDEEEEDDDMNYPMNFLEVNVEQQEDQGEGNGSHNAASYKPRPNNGSSGGGGGGGGGKSSSRSSPSPSFMAPQEAIPCPLCGQRFPTRTHLLLHTSTQHGLPSFGGDDSVEITPQMPPARPHTCDLCGKSYTLAKHLWGHVKSAHQGHPHVTCNVCGRTFSSIANLAEHKRSRHGIMGNSNSSGNTSSTNPLKRALEAVMSTGPAKVPRNSNSGDSSASASHPCMLCPSKFPGTEALNAHIQSEHGIDPTQLGITAISPEPPRSSKESSHHSTSNHHSSRSNHSASINSILSNAAALGLTLSAAGTELSLGPGPGDAVFACEICTREFGDRASLWLHMVHGHKEEAALSCGNCLKVFRDNLSLLRHVEEEHPTMQRRYSCQVCGRQHDSRKKLMKHVAIHNLQDEHGNPLDPGTMINTNNQTRRGPAMFGTPPPQGSGGPSTPTGSSGGVGRPTPSSTPGGDASFALACQLCAKLFSSEDQLLVHIATKHTQGGGGGSGGGGNMSGIQFMSPGGAGGNMSALQFMSPGQLMPQQQQVYACELCEETHVTRTERWNHVIQAHAGDEKLTCPQPQCGKIFVTSTLLADHAAHHTEQGEYPNTCEICGKMWKSRVEYFKHVMGVHPYCLPNVCGVCLKIFLSVPELREHVKDKHYPLENDHSCDVCGRGYTKRSKMTRHREIHNVTDDIPLPSTYRVFKPKADDMKCELCPDLQVESYEEIKAHRKTEHAMFVCDLCPKYYSRSMHLWKHVNRIHKGHPDVTCKLCAKVSSSREHLARHVQAHDNPDAELEEPQMNEYGESYHVCNLCQRQFKQNWLLQKHKKTCKGPKRPTSPLPEPDEDGIFRCKKCIKVFVNPDIYKKHLKHSHQKAYCEVCITAPGYETKVELLKHMKTEHKDNEDYKCDIPGCNKYFRAKLDCQKHCREHKTVKSRCPTNYCNFCADLFTNRKKLWLHLKSAHKDLTQCMCNVCFLVEGSLQQLEAHVAAKHKALLKKQYVCRLCARLLGNGPKLAEHIKIHGEHLVHCRVCGAVFHNAGDLTRHMEEHTDLPQEQKEQKPRPERRSGSAPVQDTKTEELVVSKRLRTVHTCNLCHRTFRAQGDLLKHKASEHDMPVSEHFCFTCDTQHTADTYRDHACESLTKSTEDLNSSEEQGDAGTGSKRRTWGEDTLPAPCGICNKDWPSRKYLWQHLIRSHKAMAGLACGICLQLSDNYDDLAVHLDSAHPGYFVDEADNQTCEVCGRYHNSRPKLESHRQVHAGLDKSKKLLYRCEEDKCEFVCRTEPCLKVHTAEHGEEEEGEEDETLEVMDEEEDEVEDEEEEVEDEEDELDELDEKGVSDEDEEEEDEELEEDETSLDAKNSDE